MSKQHSNCKQLLRDATEESKRLKDALRAFIRGEKTSDEVNAIADSVFSRIDALIDDYSSKKQAERLPVQWESSL